MLAAPPLETHRSAGRSLAIEIIERRKSSYISEYTVTGGPCEGGSGEWDERERVEKIARSLTNRDSRPERRFCPSAKLGGINDPTCN